MAMTTGGGITVNTVWETGTTGMVLLEATRLVTAVPVAVQAEAHTVALRLVTVEVRIMEAHLVTVSGPYYMTNMVTFTIMMVKTVT